VVDVDGVVEGVVDGVDLPPMFGQSLVDFVAAFESSTATAVVDVELPAVLDELVAPCATAPPASAAVAARVTTTLRERGNICVHLLSVGCRRSQPTPCKSNLCPCPEVPEEVLALLSERARARGS
jgi:hypothetical protein